MAYNLTKKISDLTRKTEEERLSKIGLLRATLISLLILAGISFVLSSSEVPEEEWSTSIERTFSERYEWLESSYLSFGGSQQYKKFAQSIISLVPEEQSFERPSPT